jgi:hypothetical protein
MSDNDDIGLIKSKMSHGLFACPLTWILVILPYLKNKNIYPRWEIDTYNYGMIIPNLIVPKRITSTSSNETSVEHLKTAFTYNYTKDECKLAHHLFFDYFEIAPDILADVNLYQQKFKGATLGVHYRGTDKHSEATKISITDVILNITNFLKSGAKAIETIFVITDEHKFMIEMINTFSKQYNIVVTDATKSTDGRPVHLSGTPNISLAKNALADSLVLSKCDIVIKTSSCLSDWVKIWNPDIEVYNLNTFFFDWFPQCIIPVKTF